MELAGNAKVVLERRYLKKDFEGRVAETPEQMLRRVANNIAQAEKNYGRYAPEEVAERFYTVMDRLEFLPNSPTLMNAGRELQQLAACFVLPVEDSIEGIFDAIKYAAMIHKSGGGTGFSFSRLRPEHDMVNTTGGVASGPLSFMKIFNSATEEIKQGGTRRGANMAILRVDHPDILKFISAKQDTMDFTNFNFSVGVTEKFMEAVNRDGQYALVNPRNGAQVKQLSAKMVFDRIVEMAWLNGEPGIVFLDRINRDNPTPHLGEIESTNPCGEQPLLPYESCNLGSLNLVKFVKNGEIDWRHLSEVVHTAVHFLDNVIDMNTYPLPQIETITKQNRKIGLGVMGFADMLIQLGIAYNSPEGLDIAGQLMGFIQKEARDASAGLAEWRGAFPAFAGSIYDKEGSAKLRNATLTTIAPTGTISMIAGCSSGIEPLYAVAYVRNVMDNTSLLEVHRYFEYLAREQGFYSPELMEQIARSGSLETITEVPLSLRQLFVTAHDISPEAHVQMQAAFQKYTDNAVSKTVNFPSDATKEQIAEVFQLAYKKSCKGVTVYRDGSRTGQVLSVQPIVDGIHANDAHGEGADEKGAQARADGRHSVNHGQSSKEIARVRPRPQATVGRTERIPTAHGNMYVTINEDEYGICEVFAQTGKTGGDAAANNEAIARLISISLRAGVPVDEIIKQLRGIRSSSPTWFNGGMVLSAPDGIAIAIERYLHYKRTGEEQKRIVTAVDISLDDGDCPECGAELQYEEGCAKCRSCGYSKCS